jgi:hypothetical protein
MGTAGGERLRFTLVRRRSGTDSAGERLLPALVRRRGVDAGERSL